ncbi:MAG: SIMPL domain-containing protein [Sphingobacteriaceae bacterium]
MKKVILALVLIAFAINLSAQSTDLRRKIEVNGTAEIEVTPDIIYVAISLREYIDNKKKVNIEDLERQLQSAVLKAGIAKENFTINNISAYNYSWDRKKNPDFLASKQYRIKVADLTKWNQIVNSVDAKGVQYSNIDSYDYSKMDELKKELKIKALKAAREKAIYLAESIGEKVGPALEINESGNEYYPQPVYRASMLMKTNALEEAAPMPDIDFKKIKLNYQMRAVFELK